MKTKSELLIIGKKAEELQELLGNISCEAIDELKKQKEKGEYKYDDFEKLSRLFGEVEYLFDILDGKDPTELEE
jgi:ribosome recycling factor